MGEVFNSTVDSLFKGMDSFLSSKTVVGETIQVGDTIILPLVDVSFGVAAGSFAKDADNPKSRHNNSAGGMGGKLTPSAVIVIQNGHTKLVNIKNQDSITKILDMIPEFVDKFMNRNKDKNVDEQAKAAAADKMSEMLDEAVNK